jgi:hypothetical protein
MDHVASTATLTTASIHITATAVHFRSVVTGLSTIFAETKCAMVRATSAVTEQVIARDDLKTLGGGKSDGCSVGVSQWSDGVCGKPLRARDTWLMVAAMVA